jgi:hypothetical protein
MGRPKKIHKVMKGRWRDIKPEATKITDADLKAVAEAVADRPGGLIKLDSLTIRTLPTNIICTLIEDRQGELKQLKTELFSRLV